MNTAPTSADKTNTENHVNIDANNGDIYMPHLSA